MSQATTWSVPLVGPVTPPAYSGRIDESLDAALSSHSGAARPAYAVAGTVWLSTATAGQHKYYFFDGTNDHLVLTIDTSTGAIAYSDGVSNDVLSTLLPQTSGNALDFTIAPSAAPTKKLGFGLTGITAGQTRVLTMPDRDVNLGILTHDKLETKTISGNPTNLDFVTGFDSSIYSSYVLKLNGLVPTTSAGDLQAVVTTNGGSSWSATAYNWGRRQIVFGSTSSEPSAPNDTKIIFANNIINDETVAPIRGTIDISVPATGRGGLSWNLLAHTGAAEYESRGSAGFIAAINGIRLYWSNGSTFKNFNGAELIGVRK